MRQMKLLVQISITVTLLVCFGCNQYPCRTPIEFNKAEWLKADPMKRQCMVEDLLKTNTLIGKTQSEIETLLGKPDSQIGKDPKGRPKAMFYDLGSTEEGLFGMSYKLKLNCSHATVTSCKIVGND